MPRIETGSVPYPDGGFRHEIKISDGTIYIGREVWLLMLPDEWDQLKADVDRALEAYRTLEAVEVKEAN